MDSPPLDLERRLLSLERSNRRLRLAVGALSTFALLATVGWRSAPTPPADLLRVRRLQVMGRNGTAEIELRADAPNDGGSIVVSDAYGQPKAELSTQHRGAWLQIGETTDAAGQANFVKVYASSFGSTLTAHDATGAEGSLGAGRRGASVTSSDWRRRTVEWPPARPVHESRRR